MALFFSIFFTLYALLNYYICIRGWQALQIGPQFRVIYLVVFIFASLSYLVTKFFTKFLPDFLYDIMIWVGSFWFAFMLYFFLAIVLIDLVRLINLQFHFLPQFVHHNYLQAKAITGAVVFVIVSLIVTAGFINTRAVQVKTLELNLPKKNSDLESLNAVLVSDIHLSPMDNEKFLSKIVDKINSLNPDIVFIAGDLFDDSAEILTKRNIGPALLRLKPKFGVYACTGNHEFINGIDSACAFIRNHGINLLRDETAKVGNSFYIISRDDRAIAQFNGAKRKSLVEVMNNVDGILPTILMDHTPFGLEEAEVNNIDLQLSGHTHHGQMFPANLITKMIYKQSWGYHKNSKTQYYVSCGAGTWGPPVRIGSRSEIVNLKIKFI